MSRPDGSRAATVLAAVTRMLRLVDDGDPDGASRLFASFSETDRLLAFTQLLALAAPADDDARAAVHPEVVVWVDLARDRNIGAAAHGLMICPPDQRPARIAELMRLALAAVGATVRDDDGRVDRQRLRDELALLPYEAAAG